MKRKPSKDIIEVLDMFEQFTHLILGNLFNDITMEDANAKHAEAAFVVSNQYDSENFKSDMFSILASNVIFRIYLLYFVIIRP